MEHMHISKQSKHMKVPLMCSESLLYDGQEFATYPQRYAIARGWGERKDIDLANERYGDLPPEEIEKFLQSWLYFGTLWEFFSSGEVKVELNLKGFIDSENGNVSTKGLRKVMVPWINHVVRRRETWDKAWVTRVRQEHQRLKAMEAAEVKQAGPEFEKMELNLSVLKIGAEETEERLTLNNNDKYTFEALRGEVPNYHTIAKNLGKEERDERNDWKNAEQALSTLRKYLGKYCRPADQTGTELLLEGDDIATGSHSKWPVRGEITMSMISLGWTLQAAAKYACNIPPTTKKIRNVWYISRYLVRKLLELGHCKMDVSRLSRFVQIDGLYYAATSLEEQGTNVHSSCTEWECGVPSMDEEQYIQRHVPGCEVACGEYVGPNIHDLIEVIKSGKTPVVRWVEGLEGQSGKLETGHCSGTTEEAYVAISHVWSDGMGNPKNNVLPRCVIQDIQQMVNNLYAGGDAEEKETTKSNPQSMWIWLDTLCIPVHKENHQYRIMSIERMRTIYTDANKVLVLDSWIQELPATAEAPEILQRLFFSEWLHRLWTLQEGTFAREVMYQLKGKAVSSKEAMEAGSELSKSLSKNAYFITFPFWMSHNIDDIFQSSGLLGKVMKDFLKRDMWTITDAFSWLQHFWSYRRTSHRTDETICMATLLKLEPTELLHIHERYPDETADRRLEWFLTKLSKMCKQIVFHRSERGLKDGLRWAPRSFLQGCPLDFIREPEMEGEDAWQTAIYNGGVLTLHYPGLRYEGTGEELLAAGCIILEPEEADQKYRYRLRLLEKKAGLSVFANTAKEEFSVIIRAFKVESHMLEVQVGQRFEALAGSNVQGDSSFTRMRPESIAVLDVIDIQEASDGNIPIARCSELGVGHTWNLL